MNYYKTTIEYDGTHHAGFQWQKDVPSIQRDINQAVMSIVPGKISTMGASRTDTGVHARAQVVKITSENPLECSSFISAFNQALPSQIRCLSVEACPGDFRPEHAQSKEYRYYFTNYKILPGPEQRFINNFHPALDMAAIKECLPKIIGAKNFHNFYSAGSNVKSTVREISLCELSEINPHSLFDQSEIFKLPPEISSCYQLRFVGNGFLKQMIRHIVSALWVVGSGKLAPDSLMAIDGPKIEKRLWKIAPANGLFLHQIQYP